MMFYCYDICQFILLQKKYETVFGNTTEWECYWNILVPCNMKTFPFQFPQNNLAIFGYMMIFMEDDVKQVCTCMRSVFRSYQHCLHTSIKGCDMPAVMLAHLNV